MGCRVLEGSGDTRKCGVGYAKRLEWGNFRKSGLWSRVTIGMGLGLPCW